MLEWALSRRTEQRPWSNVRKVAAMKKTVLLAVLVLFLSGATAGMDQMCENGGDCKGQNEVRLAWPTSRSKSFLGVILAKASNLNALFAYVTVKVGIS